MRESLNISRGPTAELNAKSTPPKNASGLVFIVETNNLIVFPLGKQNVSIKNVSMKKVGEKKMNGKWIKLSGMVLGIMALLALMAPALPAHANAQQPNWPYSQYTLVLPASGSCHTGGLQVRPGPNFTAEANGQSFPVQLDSATHTATFPTLPNSWAVIDVPDHTDLNLKDCNGYIDVSGITGQMEITGNNIAASQVDLMGNSHLHVDNGSISFDGSLDQYSNDLFDDTTGFISVQLPKSEPFHIDATTDNGSISTNLGTPTSFGSSGSQLSVSSQPTIGALLTVNEQAGSMNFNVV
jgi:hypothetical protein